MRTTCLQTVNAHSITAGSARFHDQLHLFSDSRAAACRTRTKRPRPDGPTGRPAVLPRSGRNSGFHGGGCSMQAPATAATSPQPESGSSSHSYHMYRTFLRRTSQSLPPHPAPACPPAPVPPGAAVHVRLDVLPVPARATHQPTSVQTAAAAAPCRNAALLPSAADVRFTPPPVLLLLQMSRVPLSKINWLSEPTV